MSLKPLPPLSKEEEDQAFAAGGPQLLDRLVRSNLAFVLKVAHQYRTCADEDDLVQAGVIGISRAFRDFDPTRGNRFITHAAWWIRDYVQKEAERGQRAGFTEATDDDGKVLQNLRKRMDADSLHDNCPTIHDGDRTTVRTRIPGQLQDNSFAEDLERALTSQECAEALQYATERLLHQPNGQKVLQVVRMRYLEEKTLQEVGDVLGFSRERARQLELKGTTILRKYLQAYVNSNGKEASDFRQNLSL